MLVISQKMNSVIRLSAVTTPSIATMNSSTMT